MEQLDKGFEIFVNWQTILVCLGIYLITYSLRTIVEYIWKRVTKNQSSLKTNHLWNELVLPLAPIGTGVLLGIMAKSFPWPMPLTESTSAKIFYGAACGLGSGWIYARFRAFMRIKVASVTGSPAKPEDLASDEEAVKAADAAMPKEEDKTP